MTKERGFSMSTFTTHLSVGAPSGESPLLKYYSMRVFFHLPAASRQRLASAFQVEFPLCTKNAVFFA